MTNLIASLPLQVLCQLITTRTPYSNDTNIAGPNSPVTVIQSPPAVQAVTLPNGYIAYPEIGTAYKMHFDLVTWTEARERCTLEGARLAILDSERKLEYVWNATYYTHNRIENTIGIYIGIYRMDGKWVGLGTGLTLSHLPWYTGYPTTSDDHCGAAWLKKSLGLKVIWHVRNCNDSCFYMCEVPIPANNEVQGDPITQISIN